MTEAAFARQFLATLDSRPIKLSSDYVADAKKLPPRAAYILPRMPKPLSKRQAPSPSSTNSSPQLTITLKPLRASATTPSSVIVENQSLLASIYDIKQQAALQTGYTPDKLKILWERKPVVDSKTVGDVIGTPSTAHEGNVDMGIMFIGEPTQAPVSDDATATAEVQNNVNEKAQKSVDEDEVMLDETPIAQGLTGEAVVKTAQFWDDLTGFITQRIRDEDFSKKLVGSFQATWQAQGHL